MEPHNRKVCAIAAGTCGITAAKTLPQNRIPFDCFEKERHAGRRQLALLKRQRAERRLCIAAHQHIEEENGVFRIPMPDDYPEYPHHSLIARYFDVYVDHFGVRDTITFRTEVKKVEPEEDTGGWRVTRHTGEKRCYRAVLVANGHHWHAYRPEHPGHFAGKQLHSHDYKTPAGWKGKAFWSSAWGTLLSISPVTFVV